MPESNEDAALVEAVERAACWTISSSIAEEMIAIVRAHDASAQAATIATLTAERDEARALVAEANNSLYGSQNYFHSLNGGDFDKHHLSRGIEELKETSKRWWRATRFAEAERDEAQERATRAEAERYELLARNHHGRRALEFADREAEKNEIAMMAEIERLRALPLPAAPPPDAIAALRAAKPHAPDEDE
ncbi:hypothetical protein CNY89_05985 [Amaricoccus sp. HAR-UPW-R2A-40]|nr:hypothetical protein CNY89_05985 [Amaricoccus sp. HAR-UPW-R2A-40]